MISGYGLKYYFEYYGHGSLKKRIEIHKKGWTSGSVALPSMGPDPITPTMEADGNDFYNAQIIATSCTIQLISTTLNQWDEISTSADDDFFIELYIDSALKGRWFVVPENTSQTIYQGATIVTVQGIDKLGDLSGYTWQDLIDPIRSSSADPVVVFGEDRYIPYKYIIEKALEFINHPQGYRIANSMTEASTSVGASETILHKMWVHFNTFTDSTDLATVLKELLLSIHASLQSARGFWYIVRYEEKQDTYTYKEFDSTFTFVETNTFNPVLTYTNDWQWMGPQGSTNDLQYNEVQLQIDMGLKESMVEFSEWTLDPTGPDNSISDGEVQMSGGSTSFGSKVVVTINDFEYTSGDYLTINLNVSTAYQDGGSINTPYSIFGYKLKYGTNYYDSADDSWSATDTLNQYFLNSGGGQVALSIPMPTSGTSPQDFLIEFYAVPRADVEVSSINDSGIITAFKAIDTTNLQRLPGDLLNGHPAAWCGGITSINSRRIQAGRMILQRSYPLIPIPESGCG